jgi:hypothetical protein
MEAVRLPRMDFAEGVAEQFLRHAGFTDVVFEPDGNVTPDFLVDGTIAVEVRRLNQHEEREGKPRGLEETDRPLLDRVQKLLASFGPPNRRASWFVQYSYHRPIEQWTTLRPRLAAWLGAFRDGLQDRGAEESFGSGFEMSLLRASDVHEHLYLLGGYSDHDAGGWVLDEMERNVRICIEEKSRKVAPVRHKYGTWWLVLIDQIGYGLSERDRESLREAALDKRGWDRVILVNPLNPTSAFEL